MKNSICLPLPTSEDSPMCRVRCFAVYPSDARELTPYPFTLRSIRFMNEARTTELREGSHTATWCATLFFPEHWPPEIIREYLAPPRISEDSGIHLPISSLAHTVKVPPRCFLDEGIEWQEHQWQWFDEKTLLHQNELNQRTRYSGTRDRNWNVRLFFPDEWPPEKIESHLKKPFHQYSLLDI